MAFTPPLFFLIKKRSRLLLVAKIVDDLFMTGVQSQVGNFIFKVNQRFRFGTISRGSGRRLTAFLWSQHNTGRRHVMFRE